MILIVLYFVEFQKMIFGMFVNLFGKVQIAYQDKEMTIVHEQNDASTCHVIFLVCIQVYN